MAFKKGQSAVEGLMVLGVALAFIIPLVLIFFSSTSLRINMLSQMEAKAMAQQISDAAGEVWYEGNGSHRTLLVNYPQGIMDIHLSGNDVDVRVSENKNLGRDISIQLDDGTGGVVDVVVVSPAPVMNNPYMDADQDLNALKNSWSGTLNSGGQVLVVKNEGHYVNVVRYVPGLEY